jgi:phosphatidylinositol alpha-1,6-mannosyltransferase
MDNNKNKLIRKYFFPKWLPAYLVLKNKIKEKKIDHIIVGHILPLGTVAYFFHMFHKKNYTVILHGMDFAYTMKKFRKKRITKKILDHATSIICANSYTAHLIKNEFPDIIDEKIIVVNPGVDIPPIIDQNQINDLINKHNLENKKILFSLGRLVKRKGFDRVIIAMPEILKYIPNLCYYIAGEGHDEKYLKQLAEKQKNIIFLGKISENEKWLWLNICDIFAMPARDIDGDFEGFGIVFLEANIAGKPVIAGNSGGQIDAVQNTYSGFLVDPENTEQIANIIIKLMSEEENAKKIGEFARQRAINEFNWQKQTNKIFNLIK